MVKTKCGGRLQVGSIVGMLPGCSLVLLQWWQ